ncbi:uncharacterized protein LOC124273258 [Haliotis rubra]|uniref:uncharacterized protein LOC124273258 n=1 Tax=Haliotis rubra TaxID=36100 RepID=UPI001EE57ED9|nr:uncharacterized protein LOC124273258 [Haliotis rubra]
MPSMYERVVAVVDRPPDLRTDFECQEFVPWFRNKATLFKSVKPEIVKDVIKHSSFEKNCADDVIIQQGDQGDKLYIVLRGKVSIYVIHDKENENDVVDQVQSACSKKKLDRSLLGQHVWTSGEGQAFGEVALIKEDCIRTASVVVDEETDLLVVDKALYNRSVRDVMEREYNEKTAFVEKNPLFNTWSTKQKRHLIISLKKETVHYGCRLTKQGQAANNMYFILRSGEVEIVLDQAAYKFQFPQQWAELNTVLPELLSDKKNVSVSPHEMLRKRKNEHKAHQICLLGENEHLGALEMVLGLESYIETATTTAACDLLVLRRGQYDRMFKRKYATQSVVKLKEDLATRLCLYIHQTTSGNCAFLKFLNMKLEDQRLLKTLKETKSRNAFKGKRRLQQEHTVEPTDCQEDEWTLILKRLHMRLDTTVSLPAASATEQVISKMEGRLKGWVERSKLHLPALANGKTMDLLPDQMKLLDQALS